VVLDSTHATLANALQATLDQRGLPLSLPGAWSILLGGLLRTGEDMSAADPVQAIERYGERPVMIVSGSNDRAIGPNDDDELLAAAVEGGAEAVLHVCEGAGHGKAIEVCPTEYAEWMLDFLGRSLPR
jgi:pimeloyl-ACP methyl ester carboxylesterase